MTPKSGILKFSKLRFLPFWTPITSCANLQLKWGFKKSCSLHQDLSNYMCHTPYTYVNQGDSLLLMVESQIDTLSHGPSFGHNLCCKYSNVYCSPILNIFVLRTFQRYKKVINLMSFDLPNHSLKIQVSIRTPTPKMGVHLGMCGLIPSHFPTLPKVWMWLSDCIPNPHISMALPWSWTQS
jgi:hypothetical protein